MRARPCADPRARAPPPRRCIRCPATPSPPPSTPTPPRTTPVGIDFGTANSAVAIFDGTGGARIVPDPDTRGVNTPSWVAVDPKSLSLVVGAKAKRLAPSNPANSYGSVKRLLGKPYRALNRADVARLGYGVVEAFDGATALWCPARGEALTPVDAAGALLASLASRAADAAAAAGTGPIGGAVVTVPADFDDAQRAAVRAAAEAAGLGADVRLLHEPVAAAVAHGVGCRVGGGSGAEEGAPPPPDELVLVVDLGGGTLDVAIVDCFEGMLEVVACAGDASLGGDDWDAAVADWAASQHPVAAALAAVGGRSPAARVRLLAAAEAAKIELTTAATTSIALRVVEGGPPVKVALTRARFDEVTHHLVARVWGPIREVADAAGVRLASRGPGGGGEAEPTPSSSAPYAPPPRTITRAILVGGGTRVPAVAAAVAEAAGVAPASGIDPEAAVALGAASYAGALAGVGGTFELADGAYAPDLHGRASGF